MGDSTIRAAERMASKWRTRELPEAVRVQLQRWENFQKGNGCFFRPMLNYPDMGELPQFAEDGVSPQLAMWIKETHGILLPTSDVERLADYLQGKSIEGLARKEWAADIGGGSIWAEELVTDGKMNFREAERFFCRKLNGELLWLFATFQCGEPSEGYCG